MKYKGRFFLLLLFFSGNLLFSNLTFQELRQLEKKLPDLKGREKVELLNKLAEEYQLENPAKAMEYAKTALQISEQENDLDGQGYAHLQIASNLKTTNREKGLKHIQLSEALFRKSGNRKGMIYNFIIQARYASSDEKSPPARSIGLYFKALEMCGDKKEYVNELKRIYVYIAQSYRKTGNLDESDHYLRSGLEIVSDDFDKALFYNQLALNYRDRQNFEKELEYFIKAAEIYRKLKAELRLAIILSNIAQTYMESHEYDKALPVFTEVLTYYKDEQTIEPRLRTLLSMGKIFIDRKRVDQAEQVLAECKRIIPGIKDNYLNFWYYQLLSDWSFLAGRYKESRIYLLEYIRYKDLYLDEKKARDLIRAQEEFNTKIKEKEVLFLKQKNRWQLIVFFSLLLVLSLGFFFLIKKFYFFFIFWKKQKYIGQYRIVERIGGGGMGIIYKAHGIKDKKRMVAIKVLKEEFFESEESTARFKREGEIIDQLDHPNIVRVFERGDSNRRHYIVLEYLEGRTLEQVIADTAPLPLGVCLDMMIQIASAMEAIHEKGIVHRDMKPANIMLMQKENGRFPIKLLDFGLSKLWFHSRLTESGMVMGTLSYHSPEQIKNLESTPASDIYSLGIVYYELLSGKLLFSGESISSITQKILKTRLPPLSSLCKDLPEELADLVMRMVAKKQKARPPIREINEILPKIQAAIHSRISE